MSLQAPQKVGVRDFRDNLAKYLETQNPIAVTKHGETIGYFVPTKAKATANELDDLLIASGKIQALLQENGVSESELVEDFKTLRKKK